MNTVTPLIERTPLPRMCRVRQKLDGTCIPEEQLIPTLLTQLARPDFAGQIRPGMRIAITCGSRGIDHYAPLVRAMVDFIRARGAKPFLVAAMGSHGGATEEGQRQILASFGITEAAMGCPISCKMDTVEVGRAASGRPVHMDRAAREADGILLFNRVKPHTSFRGPYESGLMKMMAIGLGKQRGAGDIHGQSAAIMHQLVEEYGRIILANAPVLGGVAVIENARDRICHLQCLLPEEIIAQEPALLRRAYGTIARLPFDRCDVLVVDRIGKNISGDGMDPNVTGRFCTPYASGGIRAEKVVVLGLTEETHGNAQGMGLADCTSRRLVEQMRPEVTYPTGVTNTFLHLMKIPMVMDNDREAIQLALCCCPEAEDPDNKKVIRIPDTAHLEYLEISEGLLPQAAADPRLEILEAPRPWAFDENGNLF